MSSVGTTISNTSYTGSTTTNQTINTNSNTSEELSTSSILYYIDNPKTSINYASDEYFAIYLHSKINHSSSVNPAWLKSLLQKVFNITSTQIDILFGSDGLYSTSDSENMNLDGIVFINNIKYSDFKTKLTNNSISITKTNEPSIYKLQYTGSSANYAFNCDIVFKRAYNFITTQVEPNKFINFKNNTYQLSFSIGTNNNQKGIQNGLSIHCSDVKNYIWFYITSYKPVNKIKINSNGSNRNPVIFDSASTVNGYNNNYSYPDKDGSRPLISTSTGYSGSGEFSNINSDYFLELNSSLSYNQYRTILKVYLSDKFVNEKFGSYDEGKQFGVELIFNEDNIVDFYEDSGEGISNANVFRLSANTHCSIDFVEKKTIYSRIGKKNTLIGIYKLNRGESDFNGNITVFYGNKILSPVNAVTPQIELGYYVQRRNNYLHIYLIAYDTSFILNNFINVYLSDEDDHGENTSEEEKYTNVKSTILQNDVTLHTIDINIPQVSKGDTSVLIDNTKNNKTKHYTNYTIIPTENSYSYYGVRAVGYYDEDGNVNYFNSDINQFAIEGLSYNVNCNVVKLDPTNEQNIIYSFVNGEQLLVLNKENANIKFTDSTTDSTGNYIQLSDDNNELLASYAISYEYIVEKIVPETDYNLKFTLSYLTKELKPTTYVYNSGRNYYVNVSYIYSYSIPARYDKITNIDVNYPIQYNIDNDTSNNCYTYNFIEYSSTDTIDPNNIYEEVEEFVKIPSNSISLNDFKSVVNNFSSDESEYNKYYKYSSVTGKYTAYKSSDLSKIKEVPLNLYVKYKYYLKTAETAEFVSEQLSKLDNYRRFKKNYSYESYSTVNKSDINDYIVDQKEYFQNIDGVYIPLTGFIRDGSSDYYGYKLRKLSDCLGVDEENNSTEYHLSYKQNKNIYNFVKQDYTCIGNNSSLTEEYLINNYILPKIDLYRNSDKLDDIFDFEEIDNSSNPTIYDLDLSGNTIYAYSTNRNSIFDIEDIRKEYYENLDWDEEIITKEYIERNYESSPYKINGLDDNQFKVNDQPIKYIVKLDGSFTKIDSSQVSSVLESGRYLYIKKSGYNPIRPYAAGGYTDKDKEVFEILQKYNASKNYLYTPLLTKLSADDLKENNNLIKGPNNNISDNYKYFYKVGNKYHRVDISNGIIFPNYFLENSSINGRDYSSIELYTKEQRYEISDDIHMSINKEYFTKTDTAKSVGSELLTYNDESIKWSADASYITKINLGTNYDIDMNSITFYSYLPSYYTYGPLNSKIDNLHNYKIYSDESVSSYTDDILFKSKYFYNTFTNNDGIHTDKNGSYYTNVLTFDGKDGRISKKLYLNKHIQNITKYSYNITEISYIQVFEEDLYNISIYDYDKYYIQGETLSEFIQLNSSSESPLSQSLAGERIYTKIAETKTYKYNCLDEQLSYTINDIKYPSIIKLNDSFYGLVFNDAIDENLETYTITFNKGFNYISTYNSEPEQNQGGGLLGAGNGGNEENQEEDGQVICNIRFDIVGEITKFDLGDTTSDTSSNIPNELKESALLSANNELYYNDYSGVNNSTTKLYILKNKFKPEDFIYDLVELSHFTFRNYNSDTSIIQPKKIETKEIKTEKPFSIKNGEELIFTGSYSWVNPTYKTVILDDGTKSVIIEKEGYYQKDYVLEDKALKINSYNFYPKDEVSSINISYNYNPNSYIVTAEISHPSISYNYMVNEIVERERYTYLLNGFEYDYPVNGDIFYENGSYYGNINIPTFRSRSVTNSYTSMRIKLYRKNDIVTTTSVKEVEHQKKYTSYEYFSYAQATSLTNEKIPVLYNTELIPAKSHEIQYWDINKNSYSLKTVIDSYAYYSYKYKYETIPFQVASYIYTDDLRISNFDTLGSYINVIGGSIGESLSVQSYSINNLNSELSKVLNKQITQTKTLSEKSDDLFSTYINTLNENVSSFSTQTYTSVSNLSQALTDKFAQSIETTKKSIGNLSYELTNKITDQHNVIKESFQTNSEILDIKLSDIKETLHNDLIGDSSGEKEIELVTYTTTYTPIYEEKKIVPPIGPLAIVSAVQAVTQKKKVIGYSYETKEDRQTMTVDTSSIAQILSASLSSTSSSTQRIDNEDGSYIITQSQTTSGLGDILKDLKISRKLPDYNEFMCDLVPKLFASIDFEGDYDIEYDVTGNVKSKTKRNPSDMAKKCISRADDLWKAMKKKGIVS